MTHAIEMNDVRKSFAKRAVLNGVSGNIEEGKVVGLLGRNGEGKTTLFRILLDILCADSGRISVLGSSPDGAGSIRAKVGYVPERPAFHEFWSVHESLKFRAGLYPQWDWEKALRMAREMDLDLSTRIHGASKGTLAKTAWICATAHNPKLLLLDEPTSGLDALVRDSVLSRFVGELAEEGRTVFVANHRMEELLAVLDEVWVLSNGTITRKVPIEDLRRNAVRVTGRLKPAATTPSELVFVEEMRAGDVVRWLIIDRTTVDRIRELAILDHMECEPLPPEAAFKLLLGEKSY